MAQLLYIASTILPIDVRTIRVSLNGCPRRGSCGAGSLGPLCTHRLSKVSILVSMALMRKIESEGALTGHHGAGRSVHAVEDDETCVPLALVPSSSIIPLAPNRIIPISMSSRRSSILFS